MSTANSNTADIEAALSFISPDIGREEWIRLGMALHDELGSSGFDLWDGWSQCSDKYDPKGIRADWKSFRTKPNGVTIATLFKLAKEGGYHGGEKPSSRPVRNKPSIDVAARNSERTKLALAARKKAKSLFNKATPCTRHQYATDKGIEPIGCWQHQQNLLVPMYDKDWVLSSLQIISPDGTKRFLKDCPVSGLYYVIGKPVNDTVIVVEGYATAVSVHLATGHCVAIAFSKGNLPRVAQILREKRPDFEIILAPDSDS